jgi:hypothetical protein
MNEWTTRMPGEHTRPFGVEELHNVFFEPDGWLGKGTTVNLGIPECELIVGSVSPDGEPFACVNRPQHNKSVKGWIRSACKLAMQQRAMLIFSCDTAEQAELAARRAAKLLPQHKRMAMERIFEPRDRARGGLS